MMAGRWIRCSTMARLQTPLIVPAQFTQRIADTFDRFDLHGKFTVIPMPSCLGRIDDRSSTSRRSIWPTGSS